MQSGEYILRINIDLKNIEKLFLKRSSTQIFMEAFREIYPRKNTCISFIIIFSIALIPASIIGCSEETVELFVSAVGTFNSIILVLFAVVFTGYSFFQALINKEFLLRLLSSTTKLGNLSDKSKLQESNEYFTNIMMLDIFSIMINAFLLITFKSLPRDFCLPLDNYINNTLAIILIWFYFALMFLIVWEMKSFVYNTFQLFNAHAGVKVIALLNEQSEKEE